MIASIVQQAYRHYIPRMGKPPGPMLDDYAVRVRERAAVAPERQGLGIGRRLLDFAEAEALRRGYREIRLYTHETMIENQRLYSALGYEETGRATQAGYDRVFMCKQLDSVGGKLTPR
jgi:GNAT superfamily N-acetyltransferase